jgi:ankyrin repeat protein
MRKFFFSTIVAGMIVAMASTTAPAQGIPEGQQLIEAIRIGDGGKAMSLLTENPTLINTRGYGNETPLLVALEKGKVDWASFFIGKGADVNAANSDGETPLILATRMASEQVVGWLIEEKAKVDQSNKVGETPLMLAVQLHNLRIAKQLIAAGADPDKSDYSGHTARDYAKLNDRDPRFAQLFDKPKP